VKTSARRSLLGKFSTVPLAKGKILKYYPGGLEKLFDNTRPFGVIIFVRVLRVRVRFCA
jgi:hypothetical protein